MITRATAWRDDLLKKIKESDDADEQDSTQSNEPLIQFKSPLELKNFQPPAGVVLVGDCHITQGTVFVVAGAPSVGKSRAFVALGVAGARGAEWFGLPV